MDPLTKAIGPELLAAFAETGAEPGQFLAHIVDALPDELLLFDRNRRLIFANAAAQRNFERRGVPLGESLDELRGALTIFDPVTQALMTPEQLPVSRALSGETVGRAECQIRPTRHGATFWVECAAQPVRGSGGEIRGAVLVMRDITDRKKHDLAVEAADQMRDFIYQGNMAGIIHSTVDGRILDCNDAMVRMLGYASRDELKSVRAQQLYFLYFADFDDRYWSGCGRADYCAVGHERISKRSARPDVIGGVAYRSV